MNRATSTVSSRATMLAIGVTAACGLGAFYMYIKDANLGPRYKEKDLYSDEDVIKVTKLFAKKMYVVNLWV